MKLKIDWKALGKALWNAVKPVLLGAVGGGVIANQECWNLKLPERSSLSNSAFRALNDTSCVRSQSS